jgi:hypothetical protein
MPMEPFFKIYIGAWAVACAVALALFVRKPAAFTLGRAPYWRFLAEPWKVLSFVAGAALITLVAPYTGDPTWDHVDGFFMSVLCYATAPYVVATLFFAARRRARLDEVYFAICVWLFSASWSYDIYLVWRDGQYPDTWFANLFASSVIYLAAGLFWNLEHRAGRGVIFSFMRERWPEPAPTAQPWRLLVYGAVFAVPAVAAVLMFVI